MTLATTLKTLLATTLAAVAVGAAAEPAASGQLEWDCARRGAPGYAEVEALIGHRGGHRLHAATVELDRVLDRACKGRTGAVLLVRRDAREPAVLRIVQR